MTTMTTTVTRPYQETVEAVREALGEQGFGVLTEIDIRQTLKEKLDVDVEPQVILGACMPQLAHQALQVEPSVAAVLPCNVFVRSLDDSSTLVEALDPDAMMGLFDADGLTDVAADARRRLDAALASLETGED